MEKDNMWRNLFHYALKKIMNNETIEIHSYPDKKRSGTRFYIHGRNIAAAVLFLIKNGSIGEKYNIAGEERSE